MIIREVAANPDEEKLAAISQFLLGRIQDTGSQKKIISYRTFANLAQGQRISLTPGLLKQMSQRPPLNAFINDVEGDDPDTATVVFQGAEQTPPEMSVDQARQTVDSMAKRATKRAI
jgi:hypothetical protein